MKGGYHPNILVVVRVVDLLFISNLFGLIKLERLIGQLHRWKKEFLKIVK